jgi:hypothetical protein
MKINIYPIYSPLHNETFLKNQTEDLITYLGKGNKHQISICKIDELYDADLSLILVESGGSEHYFKQVENKLKEPIYLLTFGNNNSLAASLEILTYIQNNNLKGEILHGSNQYIKERVLSLLENKNA